MPEPLALAEALRAAHPDIEPLHADADDIARMLSDRGADPSDDGLIAAVITEWDGLLP